MIHTNDIKDKFLQLKGEVFGLVNKYMHKTEKPISEVREFSSEDSGLPQKLVWENENASMQDKSYSFDEVTTDADYEFEDDFEFEDENDISRGRESRYS